MFSLYNGIYESYLAPSQLNLLVVGAPESGKTALLERLKVTQIPARPRNGSGGNKTVQRRIGAEELPATLKVALVATGAMQGRSQHRSLSKSSLASGGSGSGATRSTPMSSVLPTQLKFQTPLASATKSKPKATPLSNIRTSTGNAVVITEKTGFSFCPAPERYSRSAQDQDEEIIDEETEKLLLGGGRNGNSVSQNKRHSQNGIFRDDSFSSNHTSDPPVRVRCHSREFDVDTLDITDGISTMDLITNTKNDNNNDTGMQSIFADDDRPTSTVTNKALQQTLPPPPQLFHHEHDIGPPLLQSSPEEYNLKPNAKMLPLRMIRPTIGTNLAKIDMYGAKCHIFDVGGRLQDLWERYYDDCDAVIFCWKLGEDSEKPPKEPDSDDDSDVEEDDLHETVYKKQQELLNSVRTSIQDDIPFLVLGHVFGKANAQVVDTMYTTDLLLPRYHNPMTGFCCSSAKTGAGVQSAMEWLIPLAKRQQKERIASKRELDMMLEEQGKTL